MVEAPTAPGVSHASALPLWSVVTEHEEVPLHAESCKALVALHATVAPLTGVTPSDASTRTVIGFGACAPTGTDGLMDVSRVKVSVAAAPNVSAFVITLDAPFAGFVMVMFCVLSENAGAATMICAALTSSCVAVTFPMLMLSPGAKPVPCSVTTPPLTPSLDGETESA